MQVLLGAWDMDGAWEWAWRTLGSIRDCEGHQFVGFRHRDPPLSQQIQQYRLARVRPLSCLLVASPPLPSAAFFLCGPTLSNMTCMLVRRVLHSTGSFFADRGTPGHDMIVTSADDELMIGVFSDEVAGVAWAMVLDARVENGKWETDAKWLNVSVNGTLVNTPTPLPDRNVTVLLHPSVAHAAVVTAAGGNHEHHRDSSSIQLSLKMQAGGAVLVQLTASDDDDTDAMLSAAGLAQRWRFVGQDVQLYYDYYDLQKEPVIERSGMGCERPSAFYYSGLMSPTRTDMVLGADLDLGAMNAEEEEEDEPLQGLIDAGFNVIAADASSTSTFADLLELGSQHGVYAVARPPGNATSMTPPELSVTHSRWACNPYYAGNIFHSAMAMNDVPEVAATAFRARLVGPQLLPVAFAHDPGTAFALRGAFPTASIHVPSASSSTTTVRWHSVCRFV